MRRDIVGISQRQRQKYDLLKMLVEGNVTSQYDGRLMAMSYRHAKRRKRKLVSGAARRKRRTYPKSISP
jgi:hypothetical protein